MPDHPLEGPPPKDPSPKDPSPDDTSLDDTLLVDPLWTLLRAEAARSRIPQQVRTAARESLSWRDPDAALAALVADTADSDAEADTFAHVRGTGQPRLLTFVGGELTVEVEASRHGQLVDLVGQLVPGTRATVNADHRGGVTSTVADELGRFRLSAVTPGPVRLKCLVDGAAPVHTDWVLL
jgi:hypothetical protein